MGRLMRERPIDLTLRLFDPGMSPIHRAGLGGLACTLNYIERAYCDGELGDDDVPGGPWLGGQPPWSIGLDTVELFFGEATAAREYLKRLFGASFRIKSGLIDLPGAYGQTTPPNEVRAELQNGLTLTFLQHGRVRKLDKTETTLSYDVDGKPLTFDVKLCRYYKHQDIWQGLCESDGCLTEKQVEVTGSLNPGAIVRHFAFNAQTRISEGAAYVLPLSFAIVGCLALSINRGSGVLLIPEVDDVAKLARLRPELTPTRARD